MKVVGNYCLAAHKQWHCVMLITTDTMPSEDAGFIY